MLMHAMDLNVVGVVGTPVAVDILLSALGLRIYLPQFPLLVKLYNLLY